MGSSGAPAHSTDSNDRPTAAVNRPRFPRSAGAASSRRPGRLQRECPPPPLAPGGQSGPGHATRIGRNPPKGKEWAAPLGDVGDDTARARSLEGTSGGPAVVPAVEGHHLAPALGGRDRATVIEVQLRRVEPPDQTGQRCQVAALGFGSKVAGRLTGRRGAQDLAAGMGEAGEATASSSATACPLGSSA
jgi:hypothetical protein